MLAWSARCPRCGCKKWNCGRRKTSPCSKVTPEKLEKCCCAKRVLASLTFKPSLISAVSCGASAPRCFKLPTKARSRLSRHAFEVSDCWTSGWPLTKSASLRCGVKMLSMQPRVPWKTRESLPEHHRSSFAVWDGRLSFEKPPMSQVKRWKKRENLPSVGICWNPRLPQFFLSNLFCVVFVANWVDFSSAPFDLELPSTSYRVGLFWLILFLFGCVFAKSSLTCCFAPVSLQRTYCRTCHSQKSSIPTQIYCLVWISLNCIYWLIDFLVCMNKHGREVKVVILMCSIWHFIRP